MLFIIDMQNDFVDQKRGKMPVKGAEELVPGILEKIRTYEEKNDRVFYTINEHKDMEDDSRSQEEKDWGEKNFGPLEEALKPHKCVKKIYYGITPEAATKLKEELEGENHIIDEIELVGVETDVCVLSNAIIIQNMFPDSKLLIDSKLCTSNEKDLHEDALNIMKGLKMEVI